MSQTINSYQVAAFTTPVNGQPADAAQVLGNDNTVRAGHNSHDADSGVHFQSSLLANRPAAGTAGRKWLTTDGRRIYFDDGSAWQEAAYLPLVGGTLSAGVTIVDTSYGQAGIVSPTTNIGFTASGANSVSFSTNNILRWQITSAGATLAGSDNAYDFGGIANRWKDIYAGGTIRADTAYKLAANQVVTSRQTGWATSWTGAPLRTTIDTATVTLPQLAQRFIALVIDLTTHGLIGA